MNKAGVTVLVALLASGCGAIRTVPTTPQRQLAGAAIYVGTLGAALAAHSYGWGHGAVRGREWMAVAGGLVLPFGIGMGLKAANMQPRASRYNKP